MKRSPRKDLQVSAWASIPNRGGHDGGIRLRPAGDAVGILNGSAGLTPVEGPESLANRYVTEDIPFGSVAWAGMGDAVGVETPIIDALIALGSVIIGKECGRKAGI